MRPPASNVKKALIWIKKRNDAKRKVSFQRARQRRKNVSLAVMMEHAPDAREALLCWFQLNEGVAHAFRAKRLLEKPASFAALTNHSVKGGRSRKEAREKQIKKTEKKARENQGPRLPHQFSLRTFIPRGLVFKLQSSPFTSIRD